MLSRAQLLCPILAVSSSCLFLVPGNTGKQSPITESQMSPEIHFLKLS